MNYLPHLFDSGLPWLVMTVIVAVVAFRRVASTVRSVCAVPDSATRKSQIGAEFAPFLDAQVRDLFPDDWFRDSSRTGPQAKRGPQG
jgi:hypothetical protein